MSTSSILSLWLPSPWIRADVISVTLPLVVGLNYKKAISSRALTMRL